MQTSTIEDASLARITYRTEMVKQLHGSAPKHTPVTSLGYLPATPPSKIPNLPSPGQEGIIPSAV